MTSQSKSIDRYLRPGSFMYRNGQVFRIVSFDLSSLIVRVTLDGSSEIEELGLDSLLNPAGQESPPLFARSLDELYDEIEHCQPMPLPADSATLRESLLERADEIITNVQVVEQLVERIKRQMRLEGKEFERLVALDDALQRLDIPIKRSTYYKRHALYERSGGNRDRLAELLRRSSFNQTRMKRDQLHFVDTLILRYYGRKRPMRPSTLYKVMHSLWKRTGGKWLDPNKCGSTIPEKLIEDLLDTKLPISVVLENPENQILLSDIQMPSRSWFYAYLRWFRNQPDEGERVITARYGRDTWEREYLVFDSFVRRATMPLEYVFIDHYLIDVFVVDEETRSKLNRLWLTVLIDAYTRCIIGMALLYEAPGTMSVQSALKHAIWPKISHKELGLEEEWICFGIPQRLSLDNAWGHHSHSLEDLARTISQNDKFNHIELVFRPPYKARYGALIERFLGNLAGQIKEHLPGAILSSHPKDVRNAAKEACLLFQDVNCFLHKVIVTYQHSPHRELNDMTPHQKWVEAFDDSIPLVPLLTPEVDRLFWRKSPKTHVITSKGISAFGMDYWSPDLSRAEKVGRDGKRIQYSLRFDPNDISCLAIFRDGHWVCDVYAKQLRYGEGYLSISLAERKLAQKLAKLAGRPATDWLHFVREIDDLARTRLKERKAAQKHASKPATVAMTTLLDEVAVVTPANVFDEYTALLTGFLGGTGSQN